MGRVPSNGRAAAVSERSCRSRPAGLRAAAKDSAGLSKEFPRWGAALARPRMHCVATPRYGDCGHSRRVRPDTGLAW